MKKISLILLAIVFMSSMVFAEDGTVDAGIKVNIPQKDINRAQKSIKEGSERPKDTTTGFSRREKICLIVYVEAFFTDNEGHRRQILIPNASVAITQRSRKVASGRTSNQGYFSTMVEENNTYHIDVQAPARPYSFVKLVKPYSQTKTESVGKESSTVWFSYQAKIEKNQAIR